MSTEDPLPLLYSHLVVASANEGLPMAAIGRVLSLPFDEVEVELKEALADGRIAALPQSDWPPTSRRSDRVPTAPRLSKDQVELSASTRFHLTKLEAAFLGALLQYDHTDKEKLYTIAEQQRRKRQSHVDNPDPTDPRIVDVMICKLRKKLKAQDPAFVVGTTWGRGYSIDPSVKKLMMDALSAPLS